MGNIEAIVFYLVSLVSIICAFFAIFSTKSKFSIVNILVCLIGISILFFALEFPLLGSIAIGIFCIGLTLILIMTALLTEKRNQVRSYKLSYIKLLTSFTIIFILSFLIAFFIKFGAFYYEGTVINCVIPSIKELSVQMFINYGMPFVFTGLLFLAALIGVSVLMSDIRNNKGINK